MSTFMVLAFVAMAGALCQARGAITDEREAYEYISKFDVEVAVKWKKRSQAWWNYQTNITDANNAIQNAAEQEVAAKEKEGYGKVKTFAWQNFQNATLKRWFDYFSILGESALPNDKLTRLNNIISDMGQTYATAKICDYFNKTKCDLVLENDILDIFATSNNPEQLKDAYIQWHKVAGTANKQNFIQYVTLKNEAAKLNNFSSTAEWWLHEYDTGSGTKEFEKQLFTIWKEVKPLYQQLHAYVRGKLRKLYGEKIVSSDGPIPGHLLGDIWALTWSYIERFTLPYPNASAANITKALREQNYTVLKMVELSDAFQESLGFSRMPEPFWKNSIVERPADGRNINCHPDAWDMVDKDDVRLKMCAIPNEDYFTILHHEMGHIRYYLEYTDQSNAFRAGANPGFQEGVADTFALSAKSTKHLQTIGLMSASESNNQTEINALFKMALDKVASLPYAYLVDTWRNNIFRGKTLPENYNCHYWHLKETLQGLQPPVTRTEADFDGGAKYHVPADSPFWMYYVAKMLQFQFHDSLCTIAGQNNRSDTTKKLVNCDISNSTKAGQAFGKMLSLGSSKPWPEVIETLTGSKKMSASGIMGYFKPLYDWLVAENKRTGQYIGWKASSVKYCTNEQLAAGVPNAGE